MSELEKIYKMNHEDMKATWQPIEGEETNKLLQRTFPSDKVARDKLKQEALEVMKCCGNPKEERNNITGLVFGYVQSGKTLSFTTLATLANDNGYHLVIVLAGTSTNLVEQSYRRLKDDLNIGKEDKLKWEIIKNPTYSKNKVSHKDSIEKTLKLKQDKNASEDFKKVVLITVMKNTSHLKNLIALLEQLDLTKVPTLIIDDEGDQASMNTKARANQRKVEKGGTITEDDVSTIYKRIRTIKDKIPNHTFVQYTATPQANLFIKICETLSPSFARLLTPGITYTGGQAFFKKYPYIVSSIPDSEIGTKSKPLNMPPSTLLEAMRIFFLGVAVAKHMHDFPDKPKQWSMMIHPSRSINKHNIYYRWVRQTNSHWSDILIHRPNNDPSKNKLISQFRQAYNHLKNCNHADLKTSIKDLPSFEELCKDLGYHIQATVVQELNTPSGGSSFTWDNHKSFIFVGGQAMDRGVTIKGLTVTYMPRGKGSGNADTLQQRARFFGYKKDYIGLCRVYLDAENIDWFTDYLDHEEDMRGRIEENNRLGKPLNELKRHFLLHPKLKPTRRNILSNDIKRDKFGQNKWWQIDSPHNSQIKHNQDIYEQFYKKYQDKFAEDEGHPKRTEEQKHFVAKVPLKEVYDNLIAKLEYDEPGDKVSFGNLKTVIRCCKDNTPSEEGFVYLMRKGIAKERSLNKKQKIAQLYQGQNPKTGEVIYPGDREIKEQSFVSIQLHKLDLKDTFHKDVISLAVWTPKRLSKSFIIQPNQA